MQRRSRNRRRPCPVRQLNAQTLPPFASDLNFTEFRTVTREDYAFYGQATYRLNDMFAVTAGVRYQDEDQLDEGGASSSAPGPIVQRTTRK